MADRDLRDDKQLKLVRYKILFVKRDYEDVLLHDQEELVHDDMTEDAYVAWKIAEFIQRLSSKEKEKEVKIPNKWKKEGYPDAKYREGDRLIALDEDDKKYLRVYYEVLHRYPREEFRHEEEQIKVLREIREELKSKVDIEKEIRDRIGGN